MGDTPPSGGCGGEGDCNAVGLGGKFIERAIREGISVIGYGSAGVAAAGYFH
jgi:hypothetical protein